MSYTMEFENRENASPDDSVVEYDGFAIGNCLNLATIYIFFPKVRVAPISIDHNENTRCLLFIRVIRQERKTRQEATNKST